MPLYHSRTQAGERLAQELREFYRKPDTVVLGISQNGMLVAEGLARILEVPMDFFSLCRVTAPFQPEKTIGAVDETGLETWNQEMIARYRVPLDFIAHRSQEAQDEAYHRMERYRGQRPSLDLAGKHVILTDDGIASGYSMLAAVRAASKRGAHSVTVAIPVAAPSGLKLVSAKADMVISLYTPRIFNDVQSFYEEFPMVTDHEVILLMQNAAAEPSTLLRKYS